MNPLVVHQEAHAEICPVYNFQSLFYDDYYPDTKWDNRGGIRNISWSANASIINDESVSRPFSADELDWIRSAIQSWDDALDSLKFTETLQSTQAEIVIGYVSLTSADNQPDALGYWNAWWTDNWRYRATIKLKVSATNWFSDKDKFIHAVQHEVGNVLGLGDIKPNSNFTSTQEDSWQRPYGEIPLSDFDTGMIRQLYGESTCPSTFPNAEAKALAELKAKQEAEAKALAELKAKQEAEAKTKAALSKKITITCVKGKTIKKVTAVNPKCPSGYKKK